MGALAEVGYLPGELGLYPSLAGGRVLDALGRLHPRPPVLRDELLRTLELPESDLRKRVREYSRGMKQKLGLVAALQHDPPLVILDEPTGGLEPVIQGRLLEWLAGRARAGRTVFFSSHVLSEVEELCDRVAMVREGRLLLAGPVEELRRGRSRRVEVRFAEPVEPARYAVDGVGDVEVDGLRHRFTVAGEPRALLAALAALPVEDVAIEPPSLEDAFRHLYGGAAA
jgi:ABC-2 type transport system ATP-binding protein